MSIWPNLEQIKSFWPVQRREWSWRRAVPWRCTIRLRRLAATSGRLLECKRRRPGRLRRLSRVPETAWRSIPLAWKSQFITGVVLRNKVGGYTYFWVHTTRKEAHTAYATNCTAIVFLRPNLSIMSIVAKIPKRKSVRQSVWYVREYENVNREIRRALSTTSPCSRSSAAAYNQPHKSRLSKPELPSNPHQTSRITPSSWAPVRSSKMRKPSCKSSPKITASARLVFCVTTKSTIWTTGVARWLGVKARGGRENGRGEASGPERRRRLVFRAALAYRCLWRFSPGSRAPCRFVRTRRGNEQTLVTTG